MQRIKNTYFTKYDIEYNNASGKEHGVFLYDYAQFTGAEKQYQTFSVPGRNGDLVGEDEGKSNLEIECTFGIISPQFMSHISVIKRWLRGTGKLIISDHQDVFYKVWKINYGDIEREIRKFGQFTATFVCSPYQFLKDGQASTNEITYNPYDLCMPIYTITGSGTFTLTVNGNEMGGVANPTIIIDTERMVAYNQDNVNQSNLLTGDYEGLYLPNGNVSISVTNGFTVSVIPQWGYEV